MKAKGEYVNMSAKMFNNCILHILKITLQTPLQKGHAVFKMYFKKFIAKVRNNKNKKRINLWKCKANHFSNLHASMAKSHKKDFIKKNIRRTPYHFISVFFLFINF